MGFKEQTQKDMAVFFNSSEFAETVLIDGEPVDVIIDKEQLKKREIEFDGLGAGAILYFAPVSAFSEKPAFRNSQRFGKRLMYIVDVQEVDGTYEIILDHTTG